MDAARQSGIDAAKNDVAAGVLRYKWRRSAGRGGKNFCQMVLDRFGMIVDDYGICFVTKDSIAFAEGYNEIVRDYLLTKHGRERHCRNAR